MICICFPFQIPVNFRISFKERLLNHPPTNISQQISVLFFSWTSQNRPQGRRDFPRPKRSHPQPEMESVNVGGERHTTYHNGNPTFSHFLGGDLRPGPTRNQTKPTRIFGWDFFLSLHPWNTWDQVLEILGDDVQGMRFTTSIHVIRMLQVLGYPAIRLELVSFFLTLP